MQSVSFEKKVMNLSIIKQTIATNENIQAEESSLLLTDAKP